MSWLLETYRGLSAVTAAQLNQLRTNLSLLKLHAHSGALGAGPELPGLADMAQIVAWHPTSVVGSWSVGFDPQPGSLSAQMLSRLESNGLNNEANYRVCLRGGTYTLKVLGDQFTNATHTPSTGDTSFYLDNNFLGSQSWWSGSSTAVSLLVTFTGLTVPANPSANWQTFKVKITGKNASSNGYYVALRFFQFHRTGA